MSHDHVSAGSTLCGFVAPRSTAQLWRGPLVFRMIASTISCTETAPLTNHRANVSFRRVRGETGASRAAIGRSPRPITALDYVAAQLQASRIVYETIAEEQKRDG